MDMNEVPWWADQIPTPEDNDPDVPDHLGGHHNYTNMDKPTFDYLVDRFDAKSMLDVGCGTGGMVSYALEKGMKAHGVDGDENMAKPYVATHDFIKGPYTPPEDVDLIWSVEFVEHVDEEYMDNYLGTFSHGKHLMMTHALPKTGGKHHVNLQWSDYWIGKLDPVWECDKEATNYIRTWSQVIPYIKWSALVFTKRV